MPLYVPAGAVLPMGPKILYVGEKPADPMELRVYRGANGSFDLYEDEGDTYHYEKGVYAVIPIRWNDATRTLTIGARKGSFPGMLKERTFDVVLVSADHGAGVEATATPDRSIHYSGRAVSVAFPR
jgi:alpha-D-xyloside xylohydrolase